MYIFMCTYREQLLLPKTAWEKLLSSALQYSFVIYWFDKYLLSTVPQTLSGK